MADVLVPGRGSAAVLTPRPTWTRKKTSHMCAPVSASSAAIRGSSTTLPFITVVLTWTVRPAATRSRMAWTVCPKWPGMPRTPSWVAAQAPSRLTDTARAPQAAIRSIMAGVSSGVTDGDRQTGTPSEVA